MKVVSEFLEFELFRVGDSSLHVSNIIAIILIIAITKFILWAINKALIKKNQGEDHGNVFALLQIIRYIVWAIAIALIMEVIGVKPTALLAGSTALLLAIGLGLQSTFNDFIAGVILLSEGTIKVGDVLEIDGDVIMIKSIGLRTSKGLNRDEIIVFIPNSNITTNKVINWSHHSKNTRFKVEVGVAYGSDVDLVIQVLKDSVSEHPDTKNKGTAEVRFSNFGDSSLDFQVLFFSENIFKIERVKSDIRRIINKKFQENNISIPFPQRDLHIVSDQTKKS